MRRRMLFSALLLFVPVSASAQLHLDRPGTNGLAFEALRPSFKGDDDFSIGTAAYFLSYHHEMRSGTRLILELPFAYASSGSDALAESSTAIGNPYIGLLFRASSGKTFDLGIRVPIAPDDELASYVAIVADVDRWEAYYPDLLSLRAGLNWQSEPRNGATFGLGAAPALWIWTDHTDFRDDAELLLTYQGNIGFRGESARAAARLSGRALLTESDLDFSERTYHQLAFTADFGRGRVRPGVYVGLPLDEDIRDDVGVVLGLTLQLAM